MIRRKHCGFTPIETLVALAVGLVLSFSVLQVYLASKQTYRAADALARIQENARFAMDLLGRDIRMAGYQGCAGPARNVTTRITDSSSFLYDFAGAAEGFDAAGADTWSPPLDASITDVLTGTDVLTVRGIFGPEARVEDSVDPGNCAVAALTLSDVQQVSSGDIAIAGNCQEASIFQITGISSNDLAHAATGTDPGNVSASLGFCFSGNGNLGRLSTRTFFLRANSLGTPALFRTDTSGANSSTEELVEGIENMQLLYGIDSDADGSVNQFIRASDVTDWDPVHSVRISLLLRSIEDNVTTDPQSYRLEGTTVTPSDHRLRTVVTATIGLRNRLP